MIGFNTRAKGSIIPQNNGKIARKRLYTVSEIIELRPGSPVRQVVAAGPEQNERRQIASSLRSPFRNKK